MHSTNVYIYASRVAAISRTAHITCCQLFNVEYLILCQINIKVHLKTLFLPSFLMFLLLMLLLDMTISRS